jgi:hypothetical protein
MTMNRNFISILLLSLIGFSCTTLGLKKAQYDYSEMDRPTRLAHYRVEKFLMSCIQDGDPVKTSRYTKIDSLKINYDEDHIEVYFNRFLAHVPYREENILKFYDELHYMLGRRFASYSVSAYSRIFPLEQLVPNYYRGKSIAIDTTRKALKIKRPYPVVRRVDNAWTPEKGLYNRNIALWHSHGWYYEQKLDRWEWQRARLFQTVEDIGPMAFTIPYLIPMLENAGANVFIPRERDMQYNEVIIDNDTLSPGSGQYVEESVRWQNGAKKGFCPGHAPYTTGENPFELGSYRQVISEKDSLSAIHWIPEIPEDGIYSVHISYFSADSNISDAHYSVYHSGGKTDFLVNQKIGGGTWIYLGSFKFRKGMHADSGKVVLTNLSEAAGGYVTADAVRFGGGIGDVEREGTTSGRPRFVEGARYYLQYAGMPDTLVYSFYNEKSDYRDDYQSRGEWVNYMMGDPYGPNKKRDEKGLGIPVDLSLAFHTDAGLSPNDTVIGTLSIYSSWDADSAQVYPDGVSRLANRDFADIMQTQIVEDVRQKYDPVWNRRGLWDRQYSEAYRPNTPAALLELLSHQNFLDVKFMQDPRFRFDISRAIYKSMIRFIAERNDLEYVIQPLSIDHLGAEFSGERQVRLRWQPRADPLEPSANAEKYIVYTRIEDNEFDNGRLVNNPEYIAKDLIPNVIYGFRVTAVNDGGESFPSEVISVCWPDSGDTALIINGFDRISGPAEVDFGDFKGFADFIDMGVPDRSDIGYTGPQFNYNAKSSWKDDDAPGFGSSYGNLETKVIPGNTFDFSYIHGKALRNAGYGFVTVSDEVIMNQAADITKYPFVDLILGEERETPAPKPFYPNEFITFPPELRNEIERYCNQGGNVFISGAYVGTDLFEKTPVDSSSIKFAQNTLKYFWRTNHAAHTGQIFAVDSLFQSLLPNSEFNTQYHPDIYMVEAPDAIEPYDRQGKTLFRYFENNISAAVGYRGDYGVVVLGFPFETIIKEEDRNRMMKGILKYLGSDRPK